MCEKYNIDDKTRFLVLYFDAHMDGKQIAKVLNRYERTIVRWETRTKNGEDIRVSRKGRGRPKLITEEVENKIVQLVKENPEGASQSKLAARIGISTRSIGNILAKKGFKYMGFDQDRVYTEDERMARVDFCKKMLSDEGLLYRTFFSDEMGIDLNKNRKTKAWQLPTEKIRRKAVTENTRLDCWGAISAHGATSLDIYKEGMKGVLYRQVIERHKVEMERLYVDGEFYFVQDNHPTHRMNEEWIVEQQNVKLIKLPRGSADLNIIENLWIALKEKVASDAPTNEKELRESLVSNWAVLTQSDRLQRYFAALHQRYLACIAKDGQKIKYY